MFCYYKCQIATSYRGQWLNSFNAMLTLYTLSLFEEIQICIYILCHPSHLKHHWLLRIILKDQKNIHIAHSWSWLLMTWWCTEPGHQHGIDLVLQGYSGLRSWNVNTMPPGNAEILLLEICISAVAWQGALPPNSCQTTDKTFCESIKSNKYFTIWCTKSRSILPQLIKS